MKLLRTIYQDSTGRLWEVEFTQVSDPTRRSGSREAWRIQSGRHTFVADSKKELFRLAQTAVSDLASNPDQPVVQLAEALS